MSGSTQTVIGESPRQNDRGPSAAESYNKKSGRIADRRGGVGHAFPDKIIYHTLRSLQLLGEILVLGVMSGIRFIQQIGHDLECSHYDCKRSPLVPSRYLLGGVAILQKCDHFRLFSFVPSLPSPRRSITSDGLRGGCANG